MFSRVRSWKIWRNKAVEKRWLFKMSNSRVRHLSPEKTSSILKCPSCTLQFRVNSSNDLAKFKVGLGPKRIASKDPKILNCGHVLCQICLEKCKLLFDKRCFEGSLKKFIFRVDSAQGPMSNLLRWDANRRCQHQGYSNKFLRLWQNRGWRRSRQIIAKWSWRRWGNFCISLTPTSQNCKLNDYDLPKSNQITFSKKLSYWKTLTRLFNFRKITQVWGSQTFSNIPRQRFAQWNTPFCDLQVVIGVVNDRWFSGFSVPKLSYSKRFKITAICQWTKIEIIENQMVPKSLETDQNPGGLISLVVTRVGLTFRKREKEKPLNRFPIFSSK